MSTLARCSPTWSRSVDREPCCPACSKLRPSPLALRPIWSNVRPSPASLPSRAKTRALAATACRLAHRAAHGAGHVADHRGMLLKGQLIHLPRAQPVEMAELGEPVELAGAGEAPLLTPPLGGRGGSTASPAASASPSAASASRFWTWSKSYSPAAS